MFSSRHGRLGSLFAELEICPASSRGRVRPGRTHRVRNGFGYRHRRPCLRSPMSSRSTNSEVLVIIGVGGMGVSVARRSGAGRTIVLADINAEGLTAAAGAPTPD